jgi:hypothetical protein
MAAAEMFVRVLDDVVDVSADDSLDAMDNAALDAGAKAASSEAASTG